MRDTVLLFTSLKEPVDALTDEQAGQLFKAILAYQSGEDVALDGLLKVVFLQIKQQLDYNNEKYVATCKKRSDAGKKGMLSRWVKADNMDNKAITNDNIVTRVITGDNKNNHNDNDNDNDNDIKKIKRFVPPTVDEVAAYCKERNNGVDAKSFVAFYESKGWMIGKNHMKNWKSAVQTWERRRDAEKPVKTNSFNNFNQRKYDFDELEKEALL